MAKNVTFQLDTAAAEEILTKMMMPVVKRSADAIANRARGMASSQSSDAPAFTIKTRVGTIRKGRRAIGTVSAPINDKRDSYLAHMALSKSIDAGRVN